METIERLLIVLIFTLLSHSVSYANSTEPPISKYDIESGNYLYSKLPTPSSLFSHLLFFKEKHSPTQVSENLETKERFFKLFMDYSTSKKLTTDEYALLDIDSVLTNWYESKSSYGNEFDFELDSMYSDTAMIADSVFSERISKIPAIIELAYNEDVRTEINRYLRKKSAGYVQRLIGKAEYYIPMFEEVLDASNMPLELKYLPIIESAANPVAISPAGATGMWQFMPGTGKRFDLQIDKYIDERCSPLESTYAAAEYLQYLYDRYEDWTLALAAYNCGSGNVNKAIKASKGGTTYWEIRRYLPRETQKYVPRYIAAVYLMTYYKEHNLVPEKFDMPLILDTVEVNTNLHLSQVAQAIDIPVEMLRTLNPQYKQDIIPAGEISYRLTLPMEYTFKFIELQDSIYGTDIEPTEYRMVNFTTPAEQMDLKDREKIVYTVKSGDNVGLIAQWYDVSSTNIKRWNGLSSNRIVVGEELDIYVPKVQATKYQKVNTLNFEQKQTFCGASSAPSSKSSSPIKTKKEDGYLYYTVQSGDNYWEIAKKFEGVSNEDIIKINNFTKSTKIYPGDEIKIKKL